MKKGKAVIWMIASGLMLVFLVGMNNSCFAEGVEIWSDNGWTTALSNGFPIDTGVPHNALLPQIAVAPNGLIYITYFQIDDAGDEHIYLNRYNGTNVQIWGNGGWTTNLEEGIPIDPAIGRAGAFVPELAVDSNNNVYITYTVSALYYNVYLNRYDDSEGVMQIWGIQGEGPAGWTPIPLGDGITPVSINGENITLDWDEDVAFPQIAIDSNNNVYITYSYHILGQLFSNVSLNRYDDNDGVQVWGDSGWTDILNAGIPIDPNTENCGAPVLAVDYSNNNIYIAYTHLPSEINSTFLNRYNGTDVQIWDNDTGDWVTNFDDGDSIDPGNGVAYSPHIAVDSQSRVYISYMLTPAVGLPGIYLNRYSDEDGVQIWDNEQSPPSWNTNTEGVLPITPVDSSAVSPNIAIDSDNVVYISYNFLNNGELPSRICLNRYDDNEGVQVWGDDGWTDTLNAGIPIDPGTQSCGPSELSIDSNDNVYITYAHLAVASAYLNRYNGTDVRIWDNDTDDWVTNFDDGDSIDLGNGTVFLPQITAAGDVIYVTYGYMLIDGPSHVYLDRYITPGNSPDSDDEEEEKKPCFLEKILGMARAKDSEDKIIVLRRFRDKNLLTNPVGQVFVAAYYRISPMMVGFAQQYPVLNSTTRKVLKPVIWLCEKTIEK